MFTKGAVIKALLKTIEEKDKVIKDLVDRLMAKDYQNFKEFETAVRIDGKNISQHEVEEIMEGLIGEVR